MYVPCLKEQQTLMKRTNTAVGDYIFFGYAVLPVKIYVYRCRGYINICGRRVLDGK